MFYQNFDISRAPVLLIGVGNCKIVRTIGQLGKTWTQRSKTWGTFDIFLARSCAEGNAFLWDTASALFNQHFLYVFTVWISWKTWSQLPRVYQFLSWALCTTELSATWSCLREISFFQFCATSILWDTALFGAHSPHMSVQTARPDAGVPSTITKTEQKLTFWQSAFERFFAQWPLSLPVSLFQIADRWIFTAHGRLPTPKDTAAAGSSF